MRVIATNLTTVTGNSVRQVDTLNGYTNLTKGKAYTLINGGVSNMDQLVDDKGKTINVERHIAYGNSPISYGLISPPSDECYATFIFR